MTDFAELLLDWYARSARLLPWRRPSGSVIDPYAVWVSEIMLQQTQVETVIPYFDRWMARFPTLASLAAADLPDVLSQWEGLGYYGRARNLHRAAQIVITMDGGVLPHDLKALRRLPGVGRYTAGAIASLAFGQDEPTVDGNIRRVLARVFNLVDPAGSKESERRLWELASAHLPPGRAGEYNQALMDLGATLCLPRAPDCPRCPVASLCQAHALGLQAQRPVVRPRPALPHYTVTAAVIQRPGGSEFDGTVLIARRPLDGLLGGMWEFPGGKLQPGEDLPTCLRREIVEELGAEVQVGQPLGVYRHAFTHFKITLHAFCCTLVGGEPQPLAAPEIRWARPEELADFPMGKVDRQISQRLLALHTISNPR